MKVLSTFGFLRCVFFYKPRECAPGMKAIRPLSGTGFAASDLTGTRQHRAAVFLWPGVRKRAPCMRLCKQRIKTLASTEQCASS